MSFGGRRSHPSLIASIGAIPVCLIKRDDEGAAKVFLPEGVEGEPGFKLGLYLLFSFSEEHRGISRRSIPFIFNHPQTQIILGLLVFYVELVILVDPLGRLDLHGVRMLGVVQVS